MKKKHATILLAVIGGAACLGVAIIGLLVWFFTSALEISHVNADSATVSFDEVRARFRGTDPILRIVDDAPVRARQPPAEAAAGDLKTVHLLAWDADDDEMAHIRLPFWLLRLKSGPVNISARSAIANRNVRMSMSAEELERYGPALVLDHQDEDGSHVLVWTE
jgi:hypothetical protein